MRLDGTDSMLVSCGSVNKNRLNTVIRNGMYHNYAEC